MMRLFFVLLSLALSSAKLQNAKFEYQQYHHVNPGQFHPSQVTSFTVQREKASALLRSSATAVVGAASTGALFNPVDYGADPTGVSDSSDAFDEAIADMIALGKKIGRKDPDGHIDLGGTTLHLNGGIYNISPSTFQNFKITGGSLVASGGFKKDDYVLSVGGETCDEIFPVGYR